MTTMVLLSNWIKHFHHIGLKITIILSLLFIFSSCLSRYIYTDKEIAEHYADKKVKPEFRYFQYGDKQIFHAIAGNPQKPLLVFIHGSPGAWYGYMNLMDDSTLQANFYMIAMDRLGYFKSRNGKAFVNVEEQARSIDSLIHFYNKDQAPYILFGRSYGAPIAAVIAANHSKQVQHLYMISPAMDPSTEKFFWFSRLGKWKIVRVFLPKALNAATDEKYAHIQEMKTLQPKLQYITCSTTVLTGSSDWIVDTTNFEYCKKELVAADAVFIKLKNVGHLITYEKPDYIKKMLLEDSKNE
jgi:pimeloyl-ACP methyl ester carboxylesterase